MTRTDEFLDTASALGLLINLSGKMRMLSHRAAMLILVKDRAIGKNPAAADLPDGRLQAALDEFQFIYSAMRKGCSQLRIAPDVARLLHDRNALGDDAIRTIDSFLQRAEWLSQGRHDGLIMEFVDFVAGALLTQLNQTTDGVSRLLERIHEEQRAIAKKSETTISETLTAIEQVSFSVRLIALNASTEAVRAGDVGKGFAVIAQEIRSLSDRASELVSSARLLLQ